MNYLRGLEAKGLAWVWPGQSRDLGNEWMDNIKLKTSLGKMVHFRIPALWRPRGGGVIEAFDQGLASIMKQTI